MASDRFARLESLYHAALSRPPDQRTAFLADACGGDEALRVEILSLLAQPTSGSNVLSSPVAVAADLNESQARTSLLGRRLGPYDILTRLGAGGMGEVYRARDTKLRRDVAIKILPAIFARDRERRQRFEREAVLIAALNHPHIAAIYGVEEYDGVSTLVLELVPGETLADRIARGPLAVAAAVAIARQLAEALDAAHEKGIVHRDLKPANIALAPDDVVKVLDFGLAMQRAGQDANARSHSPTMADAKTEAGMILGTAAYMSPEQARGQTVDKRTDIWAFGCVLYEMLTGRTAFGGATLVDTLGAVLNREPDWTALPDSLSAEVRRLLRRCLEKDPKRRLHDIADARIELEDARESPAVTLSPPQAAVAPSRLGPWALALVAVLALGALALMGRAYLSFAPPDVQPVRMTILPPPGVNTSARGTPAQHIAISPDGRRLAFAATDDSGRIGLWVRPLDELDARALPGTDDANYPFWSPDSRSIAFYAQGKLKRIDATGGAVLTLCDAGPAALAMGGTWNRDGIILFANALAGQQTGAIYRVSASGGERTLVSAPDAKSGEGGRMAPSFLPDGQHFLYVAVGSRGSLGIYVESLGSTERTLLMRGGSNAKYAQGHLLHLRDGTLMAQAFDPGRLQLRGDAAPIAEHVLVGGGAGTGAYTVSDSGVLAYEARPSTGGSQLAWLGRDGRLLGTVGDPGNYYGLRLSPDNRRLAVTRNEIGGPFDYVGAGDLWMFDLVQGTSSRFTFNGEHNTLPVWAPDGSRLAFACGDYNHHDVCSKLASGVGEEQVLLESDTRKLPTDWSSDGRYIIYHDDAPNTPSSVWALPTFGDRKPVALRRTQSHESQARLSPDGRWLAYTSDQDGKTAVYVQGFPTASGPWQVSSGGGEEPRWRGDAKELFYVATDGTVMAVPITADPVFSAGAATPLFHTRMSRFMMGSLFIDYAVAADGQRFLVNQPLSNGTPITVVQNWISGLKR